MKRRINSGGIAALLLCMFFSVLTFGCGQYQAATPVLPGAPAPAVAVSFCQASENGCTSNGSFQVKSVRKLNVVIEWENLPAGTHSQKVTFVLPSGDEYQTFEHSFEIAEGSSGSATMTQTLPVAGTWIAQRRLTGMWQVNYFLDGSPMGSQALLLTQ